jgi:pyruvate ferredoxin oxidoreductase beta subunit
MKAIEELRSPVIVIPAGCSTVIAGLHPNSAMRIPVVHVPFSSTTAVACGLSEAYRRQGVDATVIAWMGDGAADIGFAALSASATRNDDILVIVADNEAYMNTGTQASLTTFWKAKTTTSPDGKGEERRNLALIMAMHNVPYVATATVGFMEDFRRKVKRASRMKGFRLIHLHTPCPPGWGFSSDRTVEVARKAVMSGAWILWEYDGRFAISAPSVKYADKTKRISLGDYLNQGRFVHLTEKDLGEIEEKIDREWKIIIKLAEL